MERDKELSVDFIGEQGTQLTEKEKESISLFVKKQKENRLKRLKQKPVSNN